MKSKQRQTAPDYVVVSVSHETSRGMTSGCSVSCCRIPQMLRVIRNSCLTISRRTFLERETAPDADSPSTVIDRCRCTREKLSVLPRTGATNARKFERMTLSTFPESAVNIGGQIVAHGCLTRCAATRRRARARAVQIFRGGVIQTPLKWVSHLESAIFSSVFV
jgi:hypothetical protein